MSPRIIFNRYFYIILLNTNQIILFRFNNNHIVALGLRNSYGEAEMIKVSPGITLDDTEIQFTFIRSPGPGGQNVNKLATAVVLRFNVMESTSLPEDLRMRLLVNSKKKLTTHGDLIIKASRFRTQERNKQDALNRLIEFIRQVAIPPKKRKKTKPTVNSRERRLTSKKKKSNLKSLRRNVIP